MVNPVKRPPQGWVWFLVWIKNLRKPLVIPYRVWTGDDINICSEFSAKFLMRAYRYVVYNFERGYTWHGNFGPWNLLVSSDGELHFQINCDPVLSTHTDDLFQDLCGLNSCLLHHFTLNGYPALYIPELRYFTTHPPASIWDSQRCWERYLDFLKYQFVFADPIARAVLSDMIWTAATHMGSDDWAAFTQIMIAVWNSLPIPSSKRDWVRFAHGNPIYHEMLEFQGFNTNSQYHFRPRTLYRFCRHNDVHGPQKTIVELLRGGNVGGPQDAHEEDLGANTGQQAWDALRQAAAVRQQEREAAARQQAQGAASGQQGQGAASGQQAQGAASGQQGPGAASGQQGQGAASGQQGQGAAGLPNTVNIQTMVNPVELVLMLARDFGMFIAHATAMVVIELDLGPFRAYIDEPYNLFKKTIDAVDV